MNNLYKENNCGICVRPVFNFFIMCINPKVWMINRNSIQRRYKVTATHPLGRGWEVILSVSFIERSID